MSDIEQVEVLPADREAFALIAHGWWRNMIPEKIADIARAGLIDNNELIQAFARHRIAASTLDADSVIAPREPTEAMLHAARDWSAGKYGKSIGSDAAQGCYRAMIAALPTPETEEHKE